MRKIESQMCAAIQGNKNWQSANTAVTFDKETGISKVFLHGNKIAEVSDTDMTIFDGGWQTNTTKSRLNALCSEFCIAGEGVFQKDFKWFVRKFVGQSSVTGKVFNVHDFEDGFVFAWAIRRFFLNIKRTIMHNPMMTPADMFQEIVDQELADIFLDGDSLIVEDVTMNEIAFDLDYED